MLFGRFLEDQSASVVPLLGLTLVPIMVGIGAAVDYSRASSARTAMQAAGDAAALMVAKTASSLTADQIQQNATAYFNANFTRQVQNLQVTAAYGQTSSGFNVTLTSSANVATTILGLIGFSQIPLNATSSVNWNNTKLRIALVLDNTGSMSQYGKMTALKTASHNLLTQLQNAAQQNGDVYVSIIPFAKDVNADPANYNQSWIEWSGSSDTWDENNGRCSRGTYSNKTACTSHNHTWTPNSHSTWTGCVMDRDQNYDTMNTAPGAGSTLFPAEQYSYCPVPLMGLSYDWNALNTKIDAMTPNGGTNQAIGLAWGWQSLTNSPFSIPPTNSNYQYKQIIILLTDGLNTQDRWYGNGSSPSSQVDARQETLCSNIKGSGITIYTVQVNTDGDPTSTLLQQCASDSSKFFLLTTANQIVTTFGTIGTSLAQLHLSK